MVDRVVVGSCKFVTSRNVVFPIGNYNLHVLCWQSLAVVSEVCVYVFISFVMFDSQAGTCISEANLIICSIMFSEILKIEFVLW